MPSAGLGQDEGQCSLFLVSLIQYFESSLLSGRDGGFRPVVKDPRANARSWPVAVYYEGLQPTHSCLSAG